MAILTNIDSDDRRCLISALPSAAAVLTMWRKLTLKSIPVPREHSIPLNNRVRRHIGNVLQKYRERGIRRPACRNQRGGISYIAADFRLIIINGEATVNAYQLLKMNALAAFARASRKLLRKRIDNVSCSGVWRLYRPPASRRIVWARQMA